ncbi:uncharacterized protein [Antedon mediterranea]|uniref:uncharacterized protein n=1 Tax=Antedon mediterranea TaxID=105859 RepID=UPI003AF906CA
MEAKDTPTHYEQDDVFVENGGWANGRRPSYRRSSSTTTSQTPFLIKDQNYVRRISEPVEVGVGLPVYIDSHVAKQKNFKTAVIGVIMLIVLVAGCVICFYRIEDRTNDLQRQLTEMKAELEALKKSSSQRASTNDGEDAKRECVCVPNTQEDAINQGDSSDEKSSILQCCTKDSKQVKTIIEEVVQERLHFKLPDNDDSPTKPVLNVPHKPIEFKKSTAFAHVNGIASTGPGNNKMKNYITSWKDKPQLSERISYHRGRITIENTGVYFVYSQIYFYQESDINQNEPVNKTQPSAHDAMLHETCVNGEPIMKSAVPFREYTSKYHGGVFELKKGDRICVRVSSDDYQVNMDPELSFFGVYGLQESSPELPTTKPHTTTE